MHGMRCDGNLMLDSLIIHDVANASWSFVCTHTHTHTHSVSLYSRECFEEECTSELMRCTQGNVGFSVILRLTIYIYIYIYIY